VLPLISLLYSIATNSFNRKVYKDYIRVYFNMDEQRKLHERERRDEALKLGYTLGVLVCLDSDGDDNNGNKKPKTNSKDSIE